MSTSSTPPSFVRVTAVTVSPESTKGSKRFSSGELRIGPRRHTLICDEDGSLRQQFPNVELSPETQVTLRYKKSWLSRTKSRTLDTQHLFATPTKDLSVAQDGIRVKFDCEDDKTVPSMPYPAESSTPTAETAGTLTPTTKGILEDCPRFRILVIGKAGIGKSSLINTAFGINEAGSEHLKRGKANIEDGLVSPVNNRFILHDSLGFEPGDTVNYDIVNEFIKTRQGGALKDQLHAVWFCVQIPRAGGRLLEVAAEDFFQTKKKTMGTIPLIVVYTKLDLFVDELTMQLAMSSHGKPDDETLTKKARSNAETTVQERHREITELAGESLPYTAVSTKENYKYTIESLVNLTHHQVEKRDTPDARITSVVTMMAQRIDPHLKIQGTIDVGRQRYWKALGASPDFRGHAIWDCLSVIHTDIVAVWSFNDPACHLLSNEFKNLVIKTVQKMETHSASNTSKILALGGSSAGAISGLSAFISNPAAPIVLPVIAGVAIALWLYDVYQNVKNVQQIFMAFIVDLTHIMKTLFILTAHDHDRLTRRAIKFAIRLYHDSGVMSQAHNDIQGYKDGVGKDAALEMIKSMIKPERSGDSNLREYYTKLSKMDIRELNLDKEEEWE